MALTSLRAAEPAANPPPGGPGPGMGGGPGPQQERAIVKQFDQDADGRLNTTERAAARKFLAGNPSSQMRRPGGPGGGRRATTPNQPGPKVSPSDVTPQTGKDLYDPSVLRTVFLDFENADWEKELQEFHNTDVEVPAKLTVDGQVYPEVGVRFRGMSSYGMVGEGQKRSFNVSVDFAHEKQNVGGYRTLNLLNAHEDPTFLRAVLYSDIARNYLPAAKAYWVKLVVNGESWGVFINEEQFNKDFLKEWFGTTKGARWKVPGSPQGQGSLAYLGSDPERYRRIYELKSKEDPQAWAGLIRLCQVLNETPADQLPAALEPILDVDGALKFLALENVLINNDGYWVRTSDYSLYQDTKGKFHVIPHDTNETFGRPGGPGFGGGPGGGPGGRGGRGGFGPGMLLANPLMKLGDQDGNGTLSQQEFLKLSETWYQRMDSEGTGKANLEQVTAALVTLIPPPEGAPGGGPGPGPGPGPGFSPANLLAPALFAQADADHNDQITAAELTATFGRWYTQWGGTPSSALTEEQVRQGAATLMPGPGGRPGGPMAGGPGGPGGPGGGQRGPRGGGISVDGVKLDPLAAANDAGKPLLSKLLAVPAYRERYLGYVRDIAEKWLDWKTLGPMAEKYQQLLAAEVAADTRKLDTTEAFQQGLTQDAGRSIGLKIFADQRRAYLLALPSVTGSAQKP